MTDAMLTVAVVLVVVLEELFLVVAVDGCDVAYPGGTSGLERNEADPFSGGATVIRSSQTLPTGFLDSAESWWIIGCLPAFRSVDDGWFCWCFVPCSQTRWSNQPFGLNRACGSLYAYIVCNSFPTKPSK